MDQSTCCSWVREHQTEDRSLDCTPRRWLLTLTRALPEVGRRPQLPRGGSRQAWKQKPEPAGKSGLCLESCAVPAGARVTGQVRSRFPGETLQRPMMPPRPASPWCSAQGSCEALCLRLGIPFQTSGLLLCNPILQGIYSQPWTRAVPATHTQ